MWPSVLTVTASLVVLLTIVQTGQSLQCYSCNATSNDVKANACGTMAKTTCQEPANCISGQLSFEDTVKKTKYYTTIKSCGLPNGKECELFLSNIKIQHPSTTKVETVNCYVCTGDGCNEKSASMMHLSAVLVTVICYMFSKIL